MKSLIAMVSLLTLLGIPVSAVASPSPCATAVCALRGVPGPIAGAGLPIIAAAIVAACGVYWLIRRRNRSA
jgi:hypothetical protein